MTASRCWAVPPPMAAAPGTITTAALSSGAHNLTATATDAAGNTGAASSALSVTIDTTAPVAPTITSFSPDSGTVGDGITNVNMLTLTGTAEANSTVKVYDGTTLLGSATANGSGAWSFTTGTLASSTHSFTATATDAAGNTGVASTRAERRLWSTVAPTAPSISHSGCGSHYQCERSSSHGHGGSQQYGQGLRRNDAAGQRNGQRHAAPGVIPPASLRTALTVLPPPTPMRLATPAWRHRSRPLQ